MPRIAKRFLDCVVYVYPSQAAALSDEAVGGSGFVVARHVQGGYQTFVLTNRHVIHKVPNPVIRLNRMSGGTESFATNVPRWIHHPEGDDLSAYQLDVSAEVHNQAWVWEHAFLTRELMREYLGLGSDVAMLGRFAGLNGLIGNTPVARFGSIAAPNTIQEANTFHASQETIVIDCQSFPGTVAHRSSHIFPRPHSRRRPSRTPGWGHGCSGWTGSTLAVANLFSPVMVKNLKKSRTLRAPNLLRKVKIQEPLSAPLSRIPTAENKFHHLRTKLGHDEDHLFREQKLWGPTIE